MTERMTESKPRGERVPIAITKLLISHANPHGVKLPYGPNGENARIVHHVKSGVDGDVRTEIEWRPWMRMYRVTRMKKVTRTGKDGKEVLTWEPMGRPFLIPESWCCAILAEEL